MMREWERVGESSVSNGTNGSIGTISKPLPENIGGRVFRRTGLEIVPIVPIDPRVRSEGRCRTVRLGIF
jgi:hypothetical protein